MVHVPFTACAPACHTDSGDSWVWPENYYTSRVARVSLGDQSQSQVEVLCIIWLLD